MYDTQTLYLVAVKPMTDAGHTYADLKKVANEHGGGYMPTVAGKCGVIAAASFVFAAAAARQQFISALTNLPQEN